MVRCSVTETPSRQDAAKQNSVRSGAKINSEPNLGLQGHTGSHYSNYTSVSQRATRVALDFAGAALSSFPL